MRNTKRFLALTMAAVMVLGSSMVALADAGVTGDGVVEYDNSEDIEYDVIEVPTVSADTISLWFDPTGLLHEYNGDEYDEGTVYFNGVKSYAKVTATGDIYTESLSPKAKITGKQEWGDIVTVTGTTTKTIDTVAAGFFVWVPDVPEGSATSPYTKGLPGKKVELTKQNIGNWFELADDTVPSIKLKGDYKAGANVCDGNIYEKTYTKATDKTITDSVLDPLSDYVTVTSGSMSAFPNLFKDPDSGTTKVAVASGDTTGETPFITYTAAVTGKKTSTDPVTVINKSTKAKVVTAKVTLKNAGNITFKEASSDTMYNSDTTASMYIAATDGTTTNVLTKAEGATEATATYTANLAAPTMTPITYQKTSINDATGGHDYGKYEPYGVTYSSNSFYITASANPNAATAWNTLLANVTATTRPQLNVVYSVADKVDSHTVTFYANYDNADPATDTATTDASGKVTAPATITRDDYTLEGWYEDAACTPEKKVDLTTETFSDDTDLYAKWTEDITQAAGYGAWGDGGLWLGKDANNGFDAAPTKVEVSVDGSTYTELASGKYTIGTGGWVNITWANFCEGVSNNSPAASYVRTTVGTTIYTYSETF